nr:hypothetical protein [Tanacetum cinerariifolium]
MDAIFDEIRFSSIPRPSQRSLINGTDDDIDVSEVSDKVPEGLWFCNLSLEKAKGIELQVCKLSRVTNNPSTRHWEVVRQGTKAHVFTYNLKDVLRSAEG